MFYTIYRTTNLVDGKMYIGKHITDNLDDGYLGSGTYLWNSIKKHGKKNFTKEILHIFDNQQDMDEMEKRLVTEEVVDDPKFYNIALGGYGGKIVLYPDHPLYESVCKKISDAALKRSSKISSNVKELHTRKMVGMYGKKQTDKQKKAVSEKMLGIRKTPEQLKKQRESLMKTLNDPKYVHPNSGKKKPTMLCVHCNREIDKGNFSRYHGKKCKKYC